MTHNVKITIKISTNHPQMLTFVTNKTSREIGMSIYTLYICNQ